MRQNSLLIIDGLALLSKHYYATIPKELFKEKNIEKIKELQQQIQHTSYGIYTNGVTSMLKSVLNIVEKYKPTYLVICFDVTRNSFRNQLYKEYKATKPTIPNQLQEQISLMIQVLESIGITVLSSTKYESTDFAGTIAKKYEKNIDIFILTRNKDYYQLATDKTTILMMQTKEEKLELLESKFNKKRFFENSFPFNEKEVKEWIGVYPSQISDYKGLAGDVSDNIPGVYGINTAAKYLLNIYNNIEEIYIDLEKMKKDNKYKTMQIKKWKKTGLKRSPYNKLIEIDSKQQALLSRKLATIVTDIPMEIDLNNFAININYKNLETIKQLLEFYEI